MVLALALHLDPVYVGAHHVARFLVVTITVAIAARRIGEEREVESYSAASARCSERQPELLPDIDERLGKRVDQAVVVIRARRDAQPLSAFRHRRIIDRLDVDAVLGEQKIARLLAQLGIADKDRHDMRRARHHRQRRGGEHRLGAGGAILMAVAFPL